MAIISTVANSQLLLERFVILQIRQKPQNLCTKFEQAIELTIETQKHYTKLTTHL